MIVIALSFAVSSIVFAGTTVDLGADVVSMGFCYLFGAPVAAALAPLVRKY